jgi:ATP-binding protein involved in chromosome partitioning
LALPRTREGLGVVSVGQALGEAEPLDFETLGEGGSYVWRAAREFALLGELIGGVEWDEQDLLFVDLPPGAERARQYAEFLGPAATFVVVTIPSALARGVVARSVAALQRTPNALLGYVENMKGYRCPGCGDVRPLFPQSDAGLGIPLLGSLPFDPELAELCDRGGSILEHRPHGTARALGQIADRLRETLARLDALP